MSFTHTDVYKTKALVGSNGDVVWTAPVTWRVSCSFDVTWFPIDKQVIILNNVLKMMGRSLEFPSTICRWVLTDCVKMLFWHCFCPFDLIVM